MFQLAVSMIHLIENMYKKITKILTFVFKYCELQENDTRDISIVYIRLVENKENNSGEIQIDVEGSWIKKFNIRSFLQEVLKYEKLNFTVQYGNLADDSYYLYNIFYNQQKQKTETTLILQETPLLPVDFYLRISVKTTAKIMNSLFLKLKNFLKIEAPKFPSVEIQFNVTGYSLEEEDLDNKYIQMIADTVGEVIKYGLKSDFRKEVFQLINVTSRQWATIEMYNLLCQCIPENTSED